MSPVDLVARAPAGPRPVTGRRVLVWMLAFFGLVIAVNGIMAWFAISTFRGTVVDSAYKAGQAFNAEIEAARAQSARAWNVTVDVARTADGGANLRVLARDAEGHPIPATTVGARFERPSDRTLDIGIAMAEREAGIFVGASSPVASGQWDVVLSIEAQGGVPFRSRNRVILP